ncbi:hypothetical protein [Acinetobacter seifertii]|uniref:hypothetical protein n=1 Tax=Acinetobacter seifertii TaxID=1530123 RepID=UPI00124F853E|nr:hypothetical protein [Acinetobacter seifertii]MDQ9037651.1 hypothetical protein [Acinetobacter seifertii]
MLMHEQLIHRDEYARLEKLLKQFTGQSLSENHEEGTVVTIGIDHARPVQLPKNIKNRLKRMRRKAAGK